MKQLNINYKLIWLIIALLSTACMNAQTFAESNVYQGKYKVDGAMTLEVYNKYGNVQVINWDTDSILITTDVYLSSSSHKKLQKLKSSIAIKYNVTSHHILAQTIFGSNSARLINELQSFTQDIIPSTSKKIDINYKIYVPQGIKLIITNRFGDVYLDNVDNDLELNMSNGTFKSNEIQGVANINLNFVKASINKINDGKLKMYYSELDLQKAISLKCESKSSELDIKDAGVIKLTSSRDDINITNVGYLYGQASYTDMRIEFMINEFDVNMNYGSLVIEGIAETCTTIEVESERTDVEMFIPKERAFAYNIMYINGVTVHFPIKQEADFLYEEDPMMYSYEGETKKNADLSIKIRALKKCTIKMQYSL